MFPIGSLVCFRKRWFPAGVVRYMCADCGYMLLTRNEVVIDYRTYMTSFAEREFFGNRLMLICKDRRECSRRIVYGVGGRRTSLSVMP